MGWRPARASSSSNRRPKAEEYLRLVFEEKKFGNAANRILVEEFLTGEEVSFMALTDGKKFVSLAPAKDYKKAFDGETGPNTGGMGAHSPAVVLSGETAAVIVKTIIMPTIQGMTEEGRPYTGCLYAGVMLTPKRPEGARVQLPLRRSGNAGADAPPRRRPGRRLPESRPRQPRRHEAELEEGSRGLPRHRRRRLSRRFLKGQEVVIDPIDDPAVTIFHAGTVRRGGKMVNVAGRVASVCARAATLSEALAKVYEAAPKVRFEGARYRMDIGYRALEQRKGFCGFFCLGFLKQEN